MEYHKKSKLFLLILLLLFCPYLFLNISCEKWVGQAATYQLIDGKKTANGDFFDKDGLTVACNGFKLGAEIKIINPKNGKKITVIVNDRIDERSSYFVLFTPKVAKELEFEWETGLVVVEANFADVNSTERLAINGLVREGEIDIETLTKFPDIKWPEDNQLVTDETPTVKEDNGYPTEEKKDIPEKDTKIAKLDTDENNGHIEKEEDQYETMPEKEQSISPDEKMKKYAMSEDVEDKAEKKEEIKEEKITEKESQLPEKEEEIAMVTPEEKKDKPELDMDTKDAEIKEKEQPVKETPPEKITWIKSLEKGKIYIRFSTALNKIEGERRFRLFKKIFPDVIGVEAGDKYILYIGPIPEDKIDAALNNIRRFGFRDAYITKE